ncbi:MAG: FG-GAP repeat domain-containing protein, partial [Saprospiraceae bacterium]
MKSTTTSSRGYLPCVPSCASVLFSLLLLLPCGAWAQSLGAYPNTSVVAGQNTTVIPAAAPTNTVRATVGTNTNFTGVLTVNPTTGDVRVTDAKQAGVYMVTVTAFGSGSATATATFTLTVTNPACSAGNFGGSTSVAIGFGPLSSVAIGDFNGDGLQDFATANFTSDNVSIRLGDGLGGFSGSTTVG